MPGTSRALAHARNHTPMAVETQFAIQETKNSPPIYARPQADVERLLASRGVARVPSRRAPHYWYRVRDNPRRDFRLLLAPRPLFRGRQD